VGARGDSSAIFLLRARILGCGAVVVVLAGGGVPTAAAHAPSQVGGSLYLSLSNTRRVEGRATLLSATLALRRADSVFVESDGSYAPAAGGSAALVEVQIDGKEVSNTSSIDWRGSLAPVAHSFDAIGATMLAAGVHTVALVAEAVAGSFTVAAAANLSVFVHPAQTLSVARLGAPAGPFDFTSSGRFGPDLPHAALVTIPADVTGPTVALGAASERKIANDGDGMLGIYLDGKHPGPDTSLWTTNDLCICAEMEAPLFSHALLTGGSGSSSVSLDASEPPWSAAQGENPSIFEVEPRATLVVLRGGMRDVGSAKSLLRSFPDLAGGVYDHWCIGSSSGWPDCPDVGTAALLARAKIVVPARSAGVVMITAKARMGGDRADGGGTARLWITVDGKRRGSVGLQQLRGPYVESGRTMSASYLAAGSQRLRPGTHVIRLYGRADGTFLHLAYMRDVPLIWFD
jgi:hypothetical protein